jgi:hypothetical protein
LSVKETTERKKAEREGKFKRGGKLAGVARRIRPELK